MGRRNYGEQSVSQRAQTNRDSFRERALSRLLREPHLVNCFRPLRPGLLHSRGIEHHECGSRVNTGSGFSKPVRRESGEEPRASSEPCHEEGVGRPESLEVLKFVRITFPCPGSLQIIAETRRFGFCMETFICQSRELRILAFFFFR